MAGPWAYHSLSQNFPPTGKDEPAGVTPRTAPTNNSGTSTPTPVMSYAPTLALVPPLVPANLMAKYTNADLQRVTKLALELFV